MDPSKQAANSHNAMFSGGSSYMNDKNSTAITDEQIELWIHKLKNGEINKHSTMFKNRIFVITTASLLLFWLILSLALGSYHAASDGINQMGFPFTFYRAFSGKCSDCPQTGILWKGLIADLVIVLVLALLAGLFFRKRRGAVK